MSSAPSGYIADGLACIRASGALAGKRFAVAISADGTGKSASGYEGSTGAFLPQGTSAIWATQAVMLAGGQAQNYYELNTEQALRRFGGAALDAQLSRRQSGQRPDYVVSVAFIALDFIAGTTMDLQVGGIGPQARTSGVSVEQAAEIYRPGDRTTLAIASYTRQVQFRSAGLTASGFVGPGSGTLVTGILSWADQQRLQEAMRDVIALSVSDVLSRLPGVPQGCRVQILTQGRGVVRTASSAGLPEAALAAAPAAAPVAAAAPVVRVATPAVPATPAGQGAMLQIGALQSDAAARALIARARQASPALSGATAMVQKAEVNGQTYYRARLAGLAEADLPQLCGALRAAGLECMAVRQPRAVAQRRRSLRPTRARTGSTHPTEQAPSTIRNRSELHQTSRPTGA